MACSSLRILLLSVSRLPWARKAVITLAYASSSSRRSSRLDSSRVKSSSIGHALIMHTSTAAGNANSGQYLTFTVIIQQLHFFLIILYFHFFWLLFFTFIFFQYIQLKIGDGKCQNSFIVKSSVIIINL